MSTTRDIPEGFNPRFTAVGCFLEREGKFLMLLRQPHKSNGNVWGLPAGKADDVETPREAAARELFEETGYRAEPEDLEEIGMVYSRYPDFDFPFHLFRLPCTDDRVIVLSPEEHADYRWVTVEESRALPTMPGFDVCAEVAYEKKAA